jgi:hypothetical protein
MRTYQRQTISRLRLFLFDRPLHPELFEIYRDHRIHKSGYEAQIWMTGCTHVIGFYRGRSSMVELTADASAELPSRGHLLTLPLRGERDHQSRHAGGIHYMMNCQVERMSEGVFAETYAELTRLAERRGLLEVFSSGAGAPEEPLEPFSYVDYDAKPNELHIFVFHAFPQELAVVKTQSIFELA